MDLEEYYKEFKNEALEVFKRLNDTGQVEEKKWDLPVGSWEVNTVRGKVLEKATLGRIIIYTKHPDSGEETRFDMIQAHVYPASPKIPVLLHSIENMAGKEDKFSGVLDVAPVAQSEEDLLFLADGIKKLTERHGEDYEALRKKMENMYKLDQWEKAVNGGIGIHLPSALEQFDMIKEAGQQWFRSYCTIISKRINEPYDEQDEACMNSVRARILEFYLIGDRSIGISMKLGVPLEALTLGLLAPVIRY